MNKYRFWLILFAGIAMSIAGAEAATAAPVKAKIGAKEAKAMGEALRRLQVDPDPHDFLKTPKKGSAKDGATVKPLWSVTRASDGSWTLKVRATVTMKLMKKKLDREQAITITYNPRDGTMTGSGSFTLSKDIQLSVWAVPPITLKVGAGIGAEVTGSNANGGSIGLKPSIQFTCGVGVGIPYLNAGFRADVTGYVDVRLRGDRTKISATIGADIEFSIDVVVVVTVWEHKLKAWHPSHAL